MRTLENFRIFIQTLRRTVEPSILPVVDFPDEPDLDSVRKILFESPLGEDQRDIFFPSWTKTLHVLLLDDKPADYVPTCDDIEAKRQVIENDEQLAKTLDKEATNPGSVSIILQECRSKRYTRKTLSDAESSSQGAGTTSSLACVQRTLCSPSKNETEKMSFVPPYTHVFTPPEGYVPVDSVYYEQMQQSYGVMQPAVFPAPPYFVHYGVGCVPYGYVAPGFVQPFVHPSTCFGYNGVM